MSLILPLSLFSSGSANRLPFTTLDIIYHITRTDISVSSQSFIFGNSTEYGSGLSGIGLINNYNSIDTDFKPPINPNANYSIRTATLSTGNSGNYKFIIGGRFDLGISSANNLCILNLSSNASPTGFLQSFTSSPPTSTVNDIVITNRVYIVGDFTSPTQFFATYELNGTLSTVFRWSIYGIPLVTTVRCIKSDGLGNIFIGGRFQGFSNFNGNSTNVSNIIKINTAGSGTVVNNFDPNSIFAWLGNNNAGPIIKHIELMNDGRVILGSFARFQTNISLIRVPAQVPQQSKVYENFDIIVGFHIWDVTALKIDNNGKLLACIESDTLVRLYRFNIAGVAPITIDTTFGGGDGFIVVGTTTIGVNKYIYSIDIDNFNNIILGGDFDKIDDRLRNSFAVLNDSGMLLNL